MNNVLSLVGLLVALAPCASEACTAFLANASPDCPKGAVMGKSYDWGDGEGMVLINKRGVRKSALPSEAGQVPAQWTSKYASVTFNQHGREFPLGGMNEAGLAAEITFLSESKFPAANADGRPGVNQTQWIQRILDRAGSVDEAVALAREVNVNPLGAVSVPVHYLVCDKSKRCATFEYLGGRLVIHRDQDGRRVTALTNDTYERSAADRAAGKPVPEKSSASLERFAIAEEAGTSCSAEGTKKTFETLERVHWDGLSKWNIAYDLESGKVLWKTASSPDVKSLNLKAFDGSCTQPVMMFDMNDSGGGDVTSRMRSYSDETATRILSTANWYRSAPAPLRQKAVTFHGESECTHSSAVGPAGVPTRGQP